MTGRDDWTRTLNDLAVFMQCGMTVEQAREEFEIIHGFNPATGRPTPKPRQRWWMFWRAVL